jgi:hypothetical protein
MVGFCSVIRSAIRACSMDCAFLATSSVLSVPPESPVRLDCALPCYPNPTTISPMFSNESFEATFAKSREVASIQALYVFMQTASLVPVRG